VPVTTAGNNWAIVGHGEGVSLAFDTTTEAQKLDALSTLGIPVGTPCLVEALICLNANGSGSAVDFNVGLASATDADDADDIAESLFIHINGGALDIFAESDDGTTEVAATNTTVDAVEGTPFLAQWDLTDEEDIQLYINGVNVLASSVFKLDNATGPLKLLAHLEKTSDAATANVTVMRLGVRAYTAS
jgi:hypothetical protein